MNAHFAQFSQQQSAVAAALTRFEFNSPCLILETNLPQPEFEAHASALQHQLSQAMSAVQNPVLSVGLEQGARSALMDHPHPHIPSIEILESQPEQVYPLWERQSNIKRHSRASVLSDLSQYAINNVFGTMHIRSEVCRTLQSLEDDRENLDEENFIRSTTSAYVLRLGSCILDFAADLMLP